MIDGDTAIYTVLILIGIIITWEYLRNKAFTEGFTDGVVPEFFGRYFPRRYDVVPGTLRETGGWIRNPKYFEGYMDLQRLGYKGDFCRVIEKEGMPESRILACALAGQEGLDSMTYRSESKRAGMRFSRDDYVRDVDGDGKDDYCRILKMTSAPNDTWEARALTAGITRFKQSSEITDNTPPPEIKNLLWFFEGVMVWYRFFDDMEDYGENTQIRIAGDAKLDESPHKTVTKGLSMNRIPSADSEVKAAADQYLQIGENPKLEFDSIVQLRQLRAISVWAYFDEFTNNARIFDFGNGAGKDNVFLGIEGRGNTTAGFGILRARPADTDRVCNTKPAKEMSPQYYLMTSDANVDAWTCPGPEPIDSLYPEDETTDAIDVKKTANLLFEIWDTEQRKMSIRIVDAIPLKEWVHIALTTTDGASFRPTWHVYINGANVFEQPDGHMPLKSYVSQNFIGRSNWEGPSSQYQNSDERFRGSLFDFRLYRQPMSASKVKSTVDWGKVKLDIKK